MDSLGYLANGTPVAPMLLLVIVFFAVAGCVLGVQRVQGAAKTRPPKTHTI
jgi:hypothetical protein